MKILSIIAQKPMSTGSGIYLTELVRVLAEEGHIQGVVAGVYKEDSINLPEEAKFYPVYFRSEGLPFNIFGMSDEMPYESTRYCDMMEDMEEKFKREFLTVIDRAVNEIKPDIILCHHLYLLTSIVRERFPELKVYGFCHNTDLRQMGKHDLEREFIINNIRKLDRIFAPQEAQAKEVVRTYGVESDKITLVGIGYNQNIFNIDGRREGSSVKRLLFTGKIAEKKGVMSLIRSLEALEYPKDELELTLVGGAGNIEEYEIIKDMAEKCKYKINFTGRLNPYEVAEKYRENDIFVLPSFFDAIPLVVIEALACGMKVVVTELPGVRDFFTKNVSNANIRYVKLPTLKNMDEPVKEELPDFEERLAGTISEAMEDGSEADAASVLNLSWENILKKVLE
ncbi:MAG: glycosyltransferase family 4 protein [Catonella sp.]|uniref:glycosyltransferase family 4 protein n=1 Tax=Catonella sp. TaxID=2382125 RepID=UPI003F9ECC15